MASIRKPAQPRTTGRYAGLYPVRWRKVARGRQTTGYLPSVSLLDAYSEYERACWNDGVIPDPPEVHFADHIEKAFEKRSGGTRPPRDVIETSDGSSTMSLIEWVGSRTYTTANRHDYTFGAFFACADKRHSDARRREHVGLVAMPEMEPLASRPMGELDFADYEMVFHRWMACPSCVERCSAAGVTPGSTAATWKRLVPTVGRSTWDGERCGKHHTRHKQGTYEKRLRMCVAHFSATRTPRAMRAGVTAVQRDAVPKEFEIFDDVIFNASVEAGGDEAEELRYGLNSAQIEDLQDASPPHLRALPITAAFMLNRGGQELTGPRIRDVQPADPRFILDPDIPPAAGTVNLHNFRHRRVDGAYENRARGKTKSSRRECPLGSRAMAQVRDHIRTFRSTPDPNCPGCTQGHGHWPSNDHANNPHVYDEDGPVRCPMAADAPLWVDEHGGWLDADEYTRSVWPVICERAGLTEATLGWNPLPRHFRSTGTTLHMEAPNPDIALVVRLGGWSSEQMIRDYYFRRRPQALLDAAQRMEDAHFLEAAGAGVDEVARLRHELRWTAQKLEQAQRRLIQAGVDVAVVRATTAAAKPTRGTVFTADRVLDAVRTVVVGQRRGAKAVLEHLDVALAKGNYDRLRRAMVDLELPLIPNYWALRSPARQQPYLEKLETALAAHRSPSHTSRAA